MNREEFKRAFIAFYDKERDNFLTDELVYDNNFIEVSFDKKGNPTFKRVPPTMVSTVKLVIE